LEFLVTMAFFETGLSLSATNSLKLADTKVTRVQEKVDPRTRYIYIQNIDNPVKIFRETAV
jgi:O-acetylhomoserine/O-acetylserine sulfhydrylase-like pyridoxal-dependent enzyme